MNLESSRIETLTLPYEILKDIACSPLIHLDRLRLSSSKVSIVISASAHPLSNDVTDLSSANFRQDVDG